jgi:hypothetical protein
MFFNGCAALVAALSLPACDVSVGARVKVPGVDISSTVKVGSPVSASGAITISSRVIINGVKYDGSRAGVTMDGHHAHYSDLKSGQIVYLQGEVKAGQDGGTADSIVQQTTVIGPVEAVDAARHRLVVLGQVIRIDAGTLLGAGIDPWNYAGLQIGSMVAVSGFLTNKGEVRATRIDREGSDAGAQVVGRVSVLDTVNQLLRINGLTVDYGAALVDLPVASFSVGTLILVRGNMEQGILVAEEIHSAIDAYGTVEAGPPASEVTTLTFDNQDFSEIALTDVVNARIVRDQDYSVRVTVAAQAVDDLAVTQSGTRLTIGYAHPDDHVEAIDVAISMPLLESMQLSGVTNVKLEAFDQAQMILVLSGITNVEGASMRIGSLQATAEGVSHIDFGAVSPLASSEVNLSGISQLTLNMDQGASITGSIDGLSQLLYYGSDVAIEIASGPAGPVIRIGDTRY